MAREIRATERRQLVIEDDQIPRLLWEQRQRLTRVRCLDNLSGRPTQLQQPTEGRAIKLVIIDKEYRWPHTHVSLWHSHFAVSPIYRRCARKDAGIQVG